jgi:hypothetical protein
MFHGSKLAKVYSTCVVAVVVVRGEGGGGRVDVVGDV